MVIIQKILQIWLIKAANISRRVLNFYKAFNLILKKNVPLSYNT